MDPKKLEKNSKDYNLAARCAKSVYAPKKSRYEIAKKELAEQREHQVPYEKQIEIVRKAVKNAHEAR